MIARRGPRLPSDPPGGRGPLRTWNLARITGEADFPGCTLTGDILDFLRAIDRARHAVGGRPLALIEGYRVARALGYRKSAVGTSR